MTAIFHKSTFLPNHVLYKYVTCQPVYQTTRVNKIENNHDSQ